MKADDAVDISNGMYGLPQGAFRLDGKVAVVTGASQNIGLSLSLALGQAGADVVMVARESERLNKAANALRAALPDRRVYVFSADVGNKEQTDALAAFVTKDIGGVDVLVNNARANGRDGRTMPADILDIKDDAWRETFEANLLGPYRLIKSLFRERPTDRTGASVINILSGSGFQPVPTASSCPYGASKAALWMMTRYLAMHLAPAIRVNAVCPGNVTPDGEVRSVLAQKLLSSIPMGRIGKPRELAGAAVYLASEAASFTTGEVILCNGGRPW